MCTDADGDRPQGATPAAASLAQLEAHYRRYFGAVARWVAARGVPAALVEDVVHEVFLVVHRRLPDLDERGFSKAWLFGIAWRVARDFARRASRSQRHLTLLVPEAASPVPDELVYRQQAARAMQQFLDGLDADKRIVFILFEIDGMTAAEIANALGIRETTVRSRLRRARRRFEATVQRHQAAHRREAHARP